MRRFPVMLILAGSYACRATPADLSEAQKTAVTDSAIVLAKAVVENLGKLDMNATFKDYSAAADSRYMEDGSVYPSFAAYRKAYEDLASGMEYIRVTGDAWDAIVLGPDAVMVTVPWHGDMKAKGRPDYKAAGVWSALVQRREGRWQIVHTHESFVNSAELMAAITPAAVAPARP